MTDFPWLMFGYLIGLLFFVNCTIEGIDELHTNDIGSDVVRELGPRLGPIYLDLLGTLALVLWPITLFAGIIILIKEALNEES